MKLTCVLATRGRPHMLLDTLRETLRHIALPDTRIMVAADSDDHGTLAALHALANEPPYRNALLPPTEVIGLKRAFA